ncbi:hypothetical protein SKAU_G00333280 [Synaphobranchus kaupii]|uniref:Uncharacterized protein n=1 Tax=Synaphobranchus kaupii TaxID=118154 RepID=A0A9Q1ELK6_SYNKA|nr:hypothetical protein SKAU_G00333280 [Synaphobranchus kaupii]
MELHVRGWHVLLSLVLVQWARQCLCIAVKFPSDLPLSVALGRTLVLEAQIDKGPEETVSVRWSIKQGSKTYRFPNQENAKLTVDNFSKAGNYTITVMDKSGKEVSASRFVRESEVAPRVSIPLLCEVSNDSEQWDTPKFMWLANGVDTTANLSADGKMLYPSGACVHNYTCIVNSSLGTSSTHYLNTGCGTNTDDQTWNGGCTVIVWVLLVLLLAAVAAIIFCILKIRKLQRKPKIAAVPQTEMQLMPKERQTIQ